MFKLNLVNVGALGSMEIELESGLTAVLGPNGVGKSTLVNAFFFALTGETLDGASLEDMITWGHPHMIVTLTGDCFQVQRTVRREGTTKQVLTADGVDLHKRLRSMTGFWRITGFQTVLCSGPCISPNSSRRSALSKRRTANDWRCYLMCLD